MYKRMRPAIKDGQKCDDRSLALQLRQIDLFRVVALRGVFDELQELAQVLAFCSFEVCEFNANSEGGIAPGHDSGQHDTFVANQRPISTSKPRSRGVTVSTKQQPRLVSDRWPQ